VISHRKFKELRQPREPTLAPKPHSKFLFFKIAPPPFLHKVGWPPLLEVGGIQLPLREQVGKTHQSQAPMGCSPRGPLKDRYLRPPGKETKAGIASNSMGLVLS